MAALLRAQREATEQGTTVQIANPRGIVRRVFQITSLLEVLTEPERT
jgi:anti-anti-sigma regulatory factor